MKFSISYLDEVSVEFSLSRSPSGELDVDAVFPVFLGRPGRPHLSLFAKPNGRRFTPHATAWKDTPREEKVWLGKISPAALAAWNEATEEALYAEYVAALEPVDLGTLSTDQWTAHWIDWRVLHRWLRPKCTAGATVSVSAEIVDALCWHLLRHIALPTALAGLDGPRCFFVLRWRDGADEPDVRLLYHFPEGVPIKDVDGSVIIVRPPGWYWAPPDWADPTTKELSVGTRVERAVVQFGSFLDHHPRRSLARQREAPREFSAFVLGFCATEIARMALSLVAVNAGSDRAVPESA